MRDRSKESKNVVVTGGAGFIGSHLCDALVKEYNVICIDNFVSGREENIHHLLPLPNFQFINHDLTIPFVIEDFPLVKRFQVQFLGLHTIYHLACPATPQAYEQKPIETLLASSHATKNTLDIAVKYRSAFLHFSSSAVYGEPREKSVPYPEEYWGFTNPIGPLSAYTEGKRFAESLIVNYRRVHGIDARIIRLFNTYGPRMALGDGRFIPTIINQALKNEPIVLHGEPDMEMSLVYVSDVLEAVQRLMSSSVGGPINIGSLETVTAKQVIDTVVAYCGATSTIDVQPRNAYAFWQTLPEISLAKDKLGWFPIVSLKDGIRKTVDDLRGSKTIGLRDVQL